MAGPDQPIFSGLRLYELLTLVGIVIGPIAAVVITLATEHFRRKRDQRLQVLRLLLNTRAMPGDPAYTVAINMVPVEFNDHAAVMEAHSTYLEAVRYTPSRENAAAHDAQVRGKQSKLIFEIMQSLGFRISESEIQTEGYVASGFANRDRLYLDSLVALRELADAGKRS